jgi:hypothetical protein
MCLHPAITTALQFLRVRSATIDGEAVYCGKDGLSHFDKLHSHAHNDDVFLYAFDLLELNGDDLRKEALERRKGKLEKLLLSSGGGLRFVEHMEGDGPIMGKPRPVGFLAMGTDLPSVDATCARIMGLDPAKVPYLSIAAEFLGNVDERRIEQRGESPARYRSNFDVIEPIQKMRA